MEMNDTLIMRMDNLLREQNTATQMRKPRSRSRKIHTCSTSAAIPGMMTKNRHLIRH